MEPDKLKPLDRPAHTGPIKRILASKQPKRIIDLVETRQRARLTTGSAARIGVISLGLPLVGVAGKDVHHAEALSAGVP
jgi:hypothetical protein